VPVNSHPAPTFLEPQLAIPLVAVAWLLVTGLIAHVSGWARLARRFPFDPAQEGERFRFASGSMGSSGLRANYGNCLMLTVGDSGVGFSVLFLYRFHSPPFFLPWEAIESVTKIRRWFVIFYVITIREERAQIKLRGRAAVAVHNAYVESSSKVRRA
jgi:hypothetical protein